MKKAAIAWTGGKESCLALLKAKEQGFKIVALVTFVPSDNSEFKAHPQSLIKSQSRSLNIPIYFLSIDSSSYKKSYIKTIQKLHEDLSIDYLITGDISNIGDYSNWIEECCIYTDVKPFFPLWNAQRESLMNEYLLRNFLIEISLVNHLKIPSNWEGKVITKNFLSKMKELFFKHNIDLCGENGEYHTMVRHAPFFSYMIH